MLLVQSCLLMPWLRRGKRNLCYKICDVFCFWTIRYFVLGIRVHIYIMASFSLEISMQRLRIQLGLLQALRCCCQKEQDTAYL